MYGGLPTTAAQRRASKARDCLDVFGRVAVVGDERFLLARNVMPRQSARRVAVEQGVADRDVDRGRRGRRRVGCRRRRVSAATSRRNRAMLAANGLRSTPPMASSARRASSRRLVRGLGLDPAAEEPSERPEEEVARAAGRVDDRRVGQTECGDRRFEGAVEDELLDEDRGLEQRVRLLGVLGEVLVEVAEEAGVPVRVSEVVAEFARLGVESGQLLAELAGAVGGGLEAISPDGVVVAEDLAGRR